MPRLSWRICSLSDERQRAKAKNLLAGKCFLAHNSGMESIIRNVKDIEDDKRSVFEIVLGQKLRDNQQLFIRVITVGEEPPAAIRDAALERASQIAREGRANAAAQGITPEEVDAAIDEAVREHRRHKHE